MAIAPEVMAAGEGAGAGAGESSAVKASNRMPRQPAYLTRQQAAQYNSDSAEYADMKRREAGAGGDGSRPRRSSGPARSSGGSSRSSRSSSGRVASQVIRSATGGRTPIVTKLFYALFAGLVALELGSMATGRRFKIQVPRPGGGTGTQKPVYEPYFTGQSPAPAQTGATTPGPSNPFISNVTPGPITGAFLGATASSMTAGGTSVGSHPAQGINPTLYPTPQSVSGFQIPSWLKFPTFRSPY